MKQFTTHIFIFALILLMQTTISAQITLEATYSATDLRRIHLPVSGEKWYYVDDSARQIRLFNADHSPWKTVNYPTEINKKVSLGVMNMPVSETIFNRDSLLEFVWRFTDSLGNNPRVKILNERNDSVYYFSTGYNYLTVNELKGSSTKLFVENKDFPLNHTTTILSLPSMLRDTIYTNARDMRRERFSHAGEKYYFKKIKPNQIEICNTNFKNYKTVPIPISTNTLNSPDPAFFADDKLFNDDTLIEFRFSYHHAEGTFITKILKEGGQPLIPSILLADSYSRLIINKKIGESNKLIFNEDYTTNGDGYFRGWVYSLPERRLENKYPFFVKRISMKNNGLKYTKNESYDIIELFNSNHTHWKTINLIPNSGNSFDYDNPNPIVCDSVVNRDTTVEIIWTERTKSLPYEYQLRITAENGTNLATIPNARFYALNQMDKLETKLITKTWNGAKYTDTKVWRFTALTPVSEPLKSTELDVRISPNPFTTSFAINNTHYEGPLSIRLFDAVGKLILSEKITTHNTTLTPPSALPSGVYFLELTEGKRRVIKRLIKIK